MAAMIQIENQKAISLLTVTFTNTATYFGLLRWATDSP